MKSDISHEFRNGMPFLGGSLWIDFVNTRFVLNGESVDFLRDEATLARWANEAAIPLCEDLLAEELIEARILRDSLGQAFALLSAAKPLTEVIFETVNGFLYKMAIHLQLSRVNDCAALQDFEVVKGPKLAVRIATDFARFTANYEASRLKHCDNPACAMIFYDRGKNMRRRWCSTSICGNRDKVANYRARQSQAGITAKHVTTPD
ncbi:MAG: CGNR zinc finger domain-containing protein [Pseudomonadota bacterium]